MEGSKGGSRGSGLWFVEKKPMQQRWNEYVATRLALGLPVEGSFSLFKEVWMAHPEIRQRGAKGHAICDECGLIRAEKLKWLGRTDEVAKAAMRALLERDAAHTKDHEVSLSLTLTPTCPTQTHEQTPPHSCTCLAPHRRVNVTMLGASAYKANTIPTASPT